MRKFNKPGKFGGPKKSGPGERSRSFSKSSKSSSPKKGGSYRGDDEKKPFRKNFRDDDKPFKKKFGEERSEGRGKFEGRSEGKSRDNFNKGEKFRRDDDRPAFKKKYSDDRNENRGKFRRDDDRPFKKKFDEEGSEKRGKFSERSSGGSFKKEGRQRRDDDRPYKKKYDDEGSEKRGKFSERSSGDSFKKERKPRRDGDRPYKKKYDDEGSEKRGKFSERSSGGSFKKEGRPRRDDDRPYKKKLDDDRSEKRGKFNDSEESSGDAFKKERKYDRDEQRGSYKKKRRDDDEEKSLRRVKYDDFHEGRATQKEEYKRSSFSRKEKTSRTSESETGLTRLNKYLANAGIASRREADTLIKSGVVKVNGVPVTEMGFKVKPGDVVTYGDSAVKSERKVYLLLNKPKDYITTVDDPQERKTVMHLVAGAVRERVYPVGRLDRNTTGLLLLTNDGELTKKLTHPKHGIRKVYHVTLNKGLQPADFKAIAEGIELEDGPIKVDDIAFVGEGKKEIGIEIHSGRNRIVRRIFEHLGYDVVKLDRVIFAGLTKKDLARGKYRFLTQKEINFLQMIG